MARIIGRQKCNVCNWRGWEFSSDSWHLHTICLKCKSQERHRLMIACYSLLPEWSFDHDPNRLAVDGRNHTSSAHETGGLRLAQD